MLKRRSPEEKFLSKKGRQQKFADEFFSTASTTCSSIIRANGGSTAHKLAAHRATLSRLENDSRDGCVWSRLPELTADDGAS